jgi:hypothetical protein
MKNMKTDRNSSIRQDDRKKIERNLKLRSLLYFFKVTNYLLLLLLEQRVRGE